VKTKLRILVVLMMLSPLALLAPVGAEPDVLSGVVRWQDGSPAKDVTMTIGGYSTITNRQGRYVFDLSPGGYVILISPPGKSSKPVRVESPGRRDFTIDW
jgi:hypothetical protein